MPNRKGTFITFEGGDGAGKSTHLQFVAEALRMHGEDVICLREPGGTIIGEQLRSLVLDPGNVAMSNECELLIYEAARAQLVSQVIKPALDRNAIVLCDRFTDSTVAYQAFGRGLDRSFVEDASAFACNGIAPDRTILMMTGGDAEVGLLRAMQHKNADRLELAGKEFHNLVNAAYSNGERAAQAFFDIVQTARRNKGGLFAVGADKLDALANQLPQSGGGSSFFPWLVAGALAAVFLYSATSKKRKRK